MKNLYIVMFVNLCCGSDHRPELLGSFPSKEEAMEFTMADMKKFSDDARSYASHIEVLKEELFVELDYGEGGGLWNVQEL